MADRTIRVIVEQAGAKGGGTGTQKETLENANKEAKKFQFALDDLITRQRNLKKELKQLTISGQPSEEAKKVAKELRMVNREIANFNRSAGLLKTTWGDAFKSFQFKFNMLGNLISSATFMVMKGAVDAIKNFVKISKDFEQAMMGVRAITMATDDEFNKLRGDAIRLGGATIFTAEQIAKLQEELAKLGFTVPEIRAATDGVVALAQATGEDLGQSALVAGTVVRGFGLNANELTRIVDVMAESFNRSALDLYKFQETMKYVGPVAAKTGYQMEEVTAIMAKLADQGVVASQAGTGLRNILLRVADANSKLSKAMGGSARSLPELVAGLERLKEQGLDATRALQLADRYSVTALLALTNQTDKIWEMYEGLMKSRDAAQKMSEIRMNTFAGSVERLSGAWQSFVLAINEGNGPLRSFVDLLTKALEKAKQLVQTRAERAEGIGQEEFNKFKKELQLRDQATREYYTNQVFEKYKQLKENSEIEKDGTKLTKKELKELSEFDRKLRKETNDKINKDREDALKEKFISFRKELKDELGLVPEQLEVAKMENIKILANEKNLDYQKVLEKKAFYDKLKELDESYKSESIQGAIDFSEIGEDEIKKWMELEKVRIELMKDGVEKEVALMRYGYAELIQNAIHYGEDRTNLIENMYSQEAKIRNKFYEDEIKKARDQKDFIMSLTASEEDQKRTKALQEYYDDLDVIRKMNKSWEESLELRLSAYDRYTDKLNQIDESRTEKQKKQWDEDYENWKKTLAKMEAAIGDEVEDPDPEGTGKFSWKAILFGKDDEMTKQEKEIRDSLENGLNVLRDYTNQYIDMLQEQTDEAKRLADERVQTLEDELDKEYELMKDGYANNYDLKKKELEKAKQLQLQAQKEQERMQKITDMLEGLTQFANLSTAASEIIKAMTKKGGPGGAIMGMGIAAQLMANFYIMKSLAKNKIMSKYGEGGEVNGASHEQGGVPIEAEGGEYVVKASQYAKHKELIQAINEDKINKQFIELNRADSVTLDDRKYEGMMKKYFGARNVTHGNGYRIERWGNRTRRINATL